MAKQSPPPRSLVVVANTLPVRESKRRGQRRWETSPGGLVSALVPFVHRQGGAWVGWTGVAGDPPAPFEHEGIRNVPVGLSRTEVQQFYHGFCNRTLWPLFHGAVRAPEYHRQWWAGYVQVNERFARAAADVAEERALVWVQDYHLQLVPAILRDLRPDLRIGFFLHIPFPPGELFARLPWRTQLLQGLLGADVVGFQTHEGARNFLSVAQRFRVARRAGRGLVHGARRTAVGAFPISIDFARFDTHARTATVARRAAQLHETLGQGRKIILGVDRLDYTKGIDLRLEAYRELLASAQTTIRDSVLVQVAVPSRERVKEYQDLRRVVEELVGQINGEFGEIGVAAVHYLRRNLPFEELVAMYRAANVMLVTPLADGMNLVAKEYAASRSDGGGVLVLSEFAGAAAELKSAIQVNPHDVDDLQTALVRALAMSPREQARRMRRLRHAVQSHTVHDWAASFTSALGDAAVR